MIGGANRGGKTAESITHIVVHAAIEAYRTRLRAALEARGRSHGKVSAAEAYRRAASR